MLTHSGLTHGYWGEAIHTAVYLQNRSPSKALPIAKTPYELWHGQKPDLSHLEDVLPLPILRKAIDCRVPLPPAVGVPPAGRPPAVGAFSPETPSPGVGAPPTSSTTVSNPTTAEVPATYPAHFGKTYQRRAWKSREKLDDMVRNLKHHWVNSEFKIIHLRPRLLNLLILQQREQLHPLPRQSILSFEGGKS
ncbi:hypothetical protein AXG93_2090s1180 [Marchantia polymorpha subsp. ruderalis]|uniref:Reverse transcriptase Ty1/copia-type domain-containing protein n=1 Tax=Marchantia polymorpha subsp. ruderalis TaxID=1480154 RepID=A0A176WA05_MARPO|nr:hypothetical protein AXG93_2090s1180 [Marchantia polymorpha subsp. ruderalis]